MDSRGGWLTLNWGRVTPPFFFVSHSRIARDNGRPFQVSRSHTGACKVWWSIIEANEMRWFRLKDAEDGAPWGSVLPLECEKLQELRSREPRQVKLCVPRFLQRTVETSNPASRVTFWRGSQLGEGWAVNMNVCVSVSPCVCSARRSQVRFICTSPEMSQRALQLETATDRDPHRKKKKKNLAYEGGKKQKRRTLGKRKANT